MTEFLNLAGNLFQLVFDPVDISIDAVDGLYDSI